MKIKRIIYFFPLLFIHTVYGQKTKLLAFGWDFPDADQLITNVASMQGKPFDGVCFSLKGDPVEAFDVDKKPESYFGYNKLQQVKWGRFTDNYIFMRGMSKTGGSWLDDNVWNNIQVNMRFVSKIMSLPNVAGILFDAEYYYQDPLKNPWTYSKEQYPNHSFKQMQDIVRKRGCQFMDALQTETNRFSILSIWLAGLAAAETASMPLEKSKHALLISFMEGILIRKHKNVTLIDGNESAYWYSSPSQFLESGEKLQKSTVALMKSYKAKKLVPSIKISQPVFYDGIMATYKEYDRGFKNISKWNWLEENMKLAIATSNSGLVWYYYEDRNWWKNDLNDTLHYILTNPHNELQASLANRATEKTKKAGPTGKKWNNINAGLGARYIIKPGLPLVQDEVAFNYSWNEAAKTLHIDFLKELPGTVSIYNKGTRIATLKATQLKTDIKLESLKAGDIAILATYSDGNEAYAVFTD